MALFRSINNDDDNEDSLWTDDDDIKAPISTSAYQTDKQVRKQANRDLIHELESFEIFRKTIYPHKPSYGIIVVKSENLPKDLRVKVIKMDDF